MQRTSCQEAPACGSVVPTGSGFIPGMAASWEKQEVVPVRIGTAALKRTPPHCIKTAWPSESPRRVEQKQPVRIPAGPADTVFGRFRAENRAGQVRGSEVLSWQEKE